jgi:pyrroline-5-carboxylate reductase
MAEALIKGLLSSKFPAKNIMASDIAPDRLKTIKDLYNVQVTENNGKAAEFGDIIILAVKPQTMKSAVSSLSLHPKKIIFSIAAGITISALENIFKENPVVRIMPNNPALIGEGISAICLGSKAKSEHLGAARQVFGAVGEVVEVKEELMDAVTGLSGSGPAFVYLFAEAMLEAGEELKIDSDIAEKLAIQTILGSAHTLKRTAKTAKELREMVTSPKGTTFEGLKVLEERGFKDALKSAILAAANRSTELSKELN